MFQRDQVSVSGVSLEYVRVGDEGPGAKFHFCPTCGSTVYYEPLWQQQWLAVPVGAFADPSFPAPTISVYEGRMHSWVGLPDGIKHMA
jgi:hypothetical protein